MKCDNNKFIDVTFRILILIYVLWGSHAWFTWELDSLDKMGQLSVNVLFFIIAYIYKVKNNIDLLTDTKTIFAVVLFTVPFFLHATLGPLLPINYVCKYFPIYVLLSDRARSEYYSNLIIRFLAIVIVPGVIIHTIIEYINFFPGYPIAYGNNSAYVFLNYVFSLKSISWYELDSHRFFSIFAEPGYAGCLFAFVLYASKYNFSKWETYVLIVGLALTFSLGGYVCAFVGYIFVLMSRGNTIRKMAFFALLLMPIYYVSIDYNHGDNFVNTLIIQRLQPDEEKGFTGNNRVSRVTDEYFDRLVKDGTIISGIGIDGLDKINGKGWQNDFEHQYELVRGSGYKMYLITHGVLFTLLYFLFYYVLACERFPKKNDKYIQGLFVFFVLLFLPTSYPTSLTWLVLYCLSFNNHINEVLIYE